MKAVEQGYMQTASGKFFNIVHPEPDQIDIYDIAAALSKTCRFGGHCVKFYSVAEHSVLVSQRVSHENALAALMHDAAEAYLGDVPRPLKPLLTNYRQLELNVMSTIANKFGFLFPLPSEIKIADTAILTDEREQNMVSTPLTGEEWGNRLPRLNIGLGFWSPAKASYEFLTAFFRYGGNA
jgi:hypothetical protein